MAEDNLKMSNSLQRGRCRWIDSWKGLLILLVLLGHVVGGGFHLASDGMGRMFCYHAYQVIYTFHMPAFFALAGYLCMSRDNERFADFLIKRTRRLLVPYFVFGVLSVVLFLCLEPLFHTACQGMTTSYYASMGIKNWIQPFLSLVQAGGWPQGEGFRANGVLWFLPCLFSTQFFFWWIVCWAKTIPWFGKGTIILVSLCLGFICRIHSFQYLPWCLGRVPYYLVFMLFGYWVLPKIAVGNEKVKCQRWLKTLGVFLTFAYVGVVSCFPDLSRAYTEYSWFLVYGIFAVVGILLSLWVAHLLDCPVLAYLGNQSLGIMLLHKYFVVAMQMKVGLIREIFSGNLGQVLLGSSVVTLVALIGSLGISLILNRFVPWTLGRVKI